MSEFHSNVYSIKTFREKLKERYQENVYFVKGQGRHRELVCFKSLVDYILRQMKKEGSTKQSVLDAAANIIKADIRELNIRKTHYPNEQEIVILEKGKQWIPESLSNFLGQIVHSDLKNLSIGQCIVQAARPRTLIAPIPFGLGVQVEKSFGSKCIYQNWGFLLLLKKF